MAGALFDFDGLEEDLAGESSTASGESTENVSTVDAELPATTADATPEAAAFSRRASAITERRAEQLAGTAHAADGAADADASADDRALAKNTAEQRDAPSSLQRRSSATEPANDGRSLREPSPWRTSGAAIFDFDTLEVELGSGRSTSSAAEQGNELPARQQPQPTAQQRPTDSPDWEAPAPAGWWRVVNRAGCWSAAASDGHMVSWFRYGEVLAGLALVPNEQCQGANLFLRDREEDQFILAWGVMPRPDASATPTEFGNVLEQLPTGSDPPRPDVRAAHLRVVEERTAMRRRTFGEARGSQVQAASAGPSAFTTGSATAAYSCGAARALLLRAMGGLSQQDFEAKFLRDGYFYVDNALGGGTAGFCKDMALLDKFDALGQSAAADTPAGPWSQAPARRTVWLDEEAAKTRYGAPAVGNAISFLKGVADALNPMLSRHHAASAARGEPGHDLKLSAPATADAVLTVPPEVMVAVYPGGGCRLAPHVDNSFTAETGRRWNARELTAIIYANPPDWDPERDGGALVIYPHSTDSTWSESVRIDALGGRLVVFNSCFRHEVAPAYRTRRAMQLWIFRPDSATARLRTSQPHTWRVLPGGVAGLNVREGPSARSALRPPQLRGGARLEELGLVGEWLHYRKLAGEGPDTGWVVTKAKNGNALVELEDLAR